MSLKAWIQNQRITELNTIAYIETWDFIPSSHAVSVDMKSNKTIGLHTYDMRNGNLFLSENLMNSNLQNARKTTY